MFTEFTGDYNEASQWGWDEWKPYFEQLEATELSADNVEDWLAQLNPFSKMLLEIQTRLWVATTVDTSDEDAAAALNRYYREISPHVEKAFFALNTKLVESGVAPDAMQIPLRNIKALIRLFNDNNQSLIARERELNQEYNQIIGAQTVEWDGETIPLRQLTRVYKETNRERRQKAWILEQERKKQDREAFDALWRQYMDVRGQMAKNCGFDNYRQYAWLSRNRHDYMPDDAIQFTAAILEVVVPVQERLHEKRRKQLKYETLRPWDLSVDPFNRDALRPYKNIHDFIDRTEAIFYKIGSEPRENFTRMKRDNLLDIENRANKAAGGYSTYFPVSERPFIFMNAVNLEEDIITILHEAGHALHSFACRNLDYTAQTWAPMEFNEVASMAMELLASPYLTKEHGGYFSEAEAARFRGNHLREFIRRWASWMGIEVAFQHRIYTNHEFYSDPANCDALWLELWGQYRLGVDWSGYDDYILNRWRSSSLIFQSPFYMIEYGLAQIGAIQIYANALQDQAGALKKYSEALALGGTVTLSELYEAAGAKLAFDAGTLKNAVDLVESEINRLDVNQASLIFKDTHGR